MGVDRRSLTEAVRARALGLGFDAVGFAEAGPADPDGRLLAWLARGFGGERRLPERDGDRRGFARAGGGL